MALGAAGAGCGITFLGTSFFAKPGEKPPRPTERTRHDIFDSHSKKWDSMVGFDEFTTGIGRMRRRLIQYAQGEVLEVAVGTGRNFPYYSSAKVTSLFAIDFSRGMLEVTDGKREELRPIPLKLKVMSTMKMDFPDESFDTVVDTFGICSFEQPVDALREMRRVLRRDGKILLLEHGEASWEFVQGRLNQTLHSHANKYGCFPNQDIVGLVRKAGLHVEKLERKHFGTTYFLVCARDPPPDADDA